MKSEKTLFEGGWCNHTRITDADTRYGIAELVERYTETQTNPPTHHPRPHETHKPQIRTTLN